MSFDVGSIEASLTLDRTKFSTGLKDAKAEAIAFAKNSFDATLGLDTEKFHADIVEASSALTGIGDETVKLDVEIDMDDLKQVTSQAQSAATYINELDPKLHVDVDKATIENTRMDLMKLGKQIEAMRPTYNVETDKAQLISLYREAQVLERQLEAMDPEFTIKANTGELRLAYLAVARAKKTLDGDSATFYIKADNNAFRTKATQSQKWMKWFGLQKVSAVLNLRHDPFMQGVKFVKNQLKGLTQSKNSVTVRTNFMQVAREANIMSRAVDSGGNKFAKFYSMSTGKDGSKIRMITGLGSAFLGLASASVKAVQPLTSLAGSAASAGGGGGSGIAGVAGAAGAAAAGMGPLALSFAATAVPAVIAAGAIGILLAAIVPLMAVLAVGVGTVALIGAGFATLAPAAMMLGQDYGSVAAAAKNVEEKQMALNAAMKAGGKTAKELAGMEKNLTEAQKKQKTAQAGLKGAWENLNKLRNPKNADAVKKAEEAVTKIEKAQEANTKKLDAAWVQLGAARKKGDQKGIAHWESEIARLEKNGESNTKKLDTAWKNLNKVRKPGTAKQIAAAEKKVEEAQKKVDKTTRAVKEAQEKLNAARKSGSSERVKQAEIELAKAQNEQAIALKKAGGNSKKYQDALGRLHKATKPLAGAFKKAFTPAATRLADLATKTVNYAKEKLPMLGKAADKNLEELSKGFDKGYRSGTTFEDLLDELPPIMGDLGGISKNTGSAINSFLVIAAPYINDFSQWAEDASKSLAKWMDSEDGRKKINKFLAMAAPIAKELADFLGMVAGWLWKLAVNHGPAVIDMVQFMTGAVDKLFWALDKAAGVTAYLLELWEALWKPRSKDQKNQDLHNLISAQQAMGGDIAADGSSVPMARGGTVLRAASGIANTASPNRQAHYATESSFMKLGKTLVNYGESLSGQNREYAFPMDGGMRFITEEPGNDKDSFPLWTDLGMRKGWINDEDPLSAGDLDFDMPGPPKRDQQGGSGRSSPLSTALGGAAVGGAPHRRRKKTRRKPAAHDKQTAIIKIQGPNGDFYEMVADMVWENLRQSMASGSYDGEGL